MRQNVLNKILSENQRRLSAASAPHSGFPISSKYRLVPATYALPLVPSTLVEGAESSGEQRSLSSCSPAGECTERAETSAAHYLDVPYSSTRQQGELVEMSGRSDTSGRRLDTLVAAKNEVSQPPTERPSVRSITANIVSTLLLRIASRISFVLLGFYLGEHFASATAVAVVLESFYISELVLAPMIGSLSDRLGRKPFLLLAPILGAGAALALLAAALFYPHPNGAHFDLHLLLLLGLILLGRMLEGATTALNTPASLGYITDVTMSSDRLRTQVMTAFEVVTVGGLALAIPLGGLVSALLGTWGFLVVIGLHVINTLLILFFVTESQLRVERTKQHGSLLESLVLLRDKRIFTFLPAWLSINTLVGAWITLIVIMLTYPKATAALRHPGQLFYGGFGKGFATELLGGFGLFFLLGMGLWMLVIPRLRRTTVMLIGLGGLAVSIACLSIMNKLAPNLGDLSDTGHMAIILLLPILVCGILLLSGFTPASLNQMSALAEMKAGKRGAVMGLYSVVLGVGQLLGATVGGFSVDLGGFSGLMVFSVILGLLSLVSVVYMRIHKHDLIKITAIKAAHG